jgi:hypothetical protein
MKRGRAGEKERKEVRAGGEGIKCGRQRVSKEGRKEQNKEGEE